MRWYALCFNSVSALYGIGNSKGCASPVRRELSSNHPSELGVDVTSLLPAVVSLSLLTMTVKSDRQVLMLSFCVWNAQHTKPHVANNIGIWHWEQIVLVQGKPWVWCAISLSKYYWMSLIAKLKPARFQMMVMMIILNCKSWQSLVIKWTVDIDFVIWSHSIIPIWVCSRLGVT